MAARTFVAVSALLALICARSFAGEIIIWYDEKGAAHTAASRDEIPPEHRPQASGMLTSLTPAMVEMAASEGGRIGSDPLLYNDGLGIFQRFGYEMDMEQRTGYVFVGTKYNLVRAAAAGAAHGKKPLSASYAANVNRLTGLPLAFYSWGLDPVLILLIQDGRIIKGEDGFEKGVDPGLTVPAVVKTFPYESLDFSKPAEVQLYTREGNMVQARIDLPEYR